LVTVCQSIAVFIPEAETVDCYCAGDLEGPPGGGVNAGDGGAAAREIHEEAGVQGRTMQ